MPELDNAQKAAIAVTRLGLGARPGELDAVARDPQSWLLGQIAPRGADRPRGEFRTTEAWESARRDASDRIAASRRAARALPDKGEATAQLLRVAEDRRRETRQLGAASNAEHLARLRHAAMTEKGFQERWVAFWANHFTVSATKNRVAYLGSAFEIEAIRPHVFGRFEDLLVASSTHPAMLLYLDQAASIGPGSPQARRTNRRPDRVGRERGLNENLAREILELHTVGAGAGYAQADVTEFARALTGAGVGNGVRGEVGTYVYLPATHEPGERQIMGRRYADTGEGQARAVLKDLAVHPATARRVATKLARHFVADEPPPALVDRLATDFTRSKGDLALVARSLAQAPETWRPQAAKFKTPNEFVVSAFRAAGAGQDALQGLMRGVTQLGQAPFRARQPDGWSDLAADWATPTAILSRAAYARSLVPLFTGSEPVSVARACLGERLSSDGEMAISRAPSREHALTLLLMLPEFQRR